MKEKILELVLEGYSYSQICEKLNCSKATISYHCSKNNIVSKNINISITEELFNEINILYNQYGTIKKVCDLLNLKKTFVSKYVINKKNKLTIEELKYNRCESLKSWRIRTKQKLVEYKGGECSICGYDKSLRALHFHHVDPNEKDFTISSKSYSYERLKKEVDKCILVCSNCHCEIHDEIDNNKKNLKK